jgi:hypothetical protein
LNRGRNGEIRRVGEGESFDPNISVNFSKFREKY